MSLNNLEEAKMIYREEKDADFINQADIILKESYAKIYRDLNDLKITYNEAIGLCSKLNGVKNNAFLDLGELCRLKTSKDYFNSGTKYLEKGKFKQAFDNLEKVILKEKQYREAKDLMESNLSNLRNEYIDLAE